MQCLREYRKATLPGRRCPASKLTGSCNNNRPGAAADVADVGAHADCNIVGVHIQSFNMHAAYVHVSNYTHRISLPS